MQRTALIVVAAVIILLAATYGAMAATSKPDFCSNCHYIKPSVEAWKKGAHSQVGCMECHADPGPVGYVKRKVGAYRELLLHFTGKYPSALKAKVNIENCVLCHSGKYPDKYPTAKNITKTGENAEVPFNHQEIIKEKKSCLDCHEHVAHGTLENEK